MPVTTSMQDVSCHNLMVLFLSEEMLYQHGFSIFFKFVYWGGGIKVHSTLRPPVAYCVSPG
jgi:hypothetical protein